MGAGQITVEAAVGHVDFLEVRECTPFRRNSTSKLVRSFAIITVATREIENLKRSWKHLWQRTCAKKTPNSVATIKPNSELRPDAEFTSQIVVAEVNLCHRIAELADVGRKHQSCVPFQLNGAVLDEFSAQKSNRNFA